MVSDPLISTDYWTDLQIAQQDVEFLHNHLFEHETPLTARELVSVFVNERIRAERLETQQRRQAGGKTYVPKEAYQVGDDLIFPALNWKHGKVTAVRAGTNPEFGPFDVLTVDLGNGSERLFASNLPNHSLNDQPVTVEEEGFNAEEILHVHGSTLEKKIEAAFRADDEIVRIAGRWFPRALLVDVNVVPELAEAVLTWQYATLRFCIAQGRGFLESELKLAEFSSILPYRMAHEVGPCRGGSHPAPRTGGSTRCSSAFTLFPDRI
jgi:hypothetical protein